MCPGPWAASSVVTPCCPASLTPTCYWCSSLLEATFSLWATCGFLLFFFFFCIPVDKCNFVPLLGKDNIPGQSRIGGFTEVPFFTDFFFKVFLKHCVLAVLGLHCHSQAFSGASAWGLTSRGGTWASRYSGISCGARALGSGTLGAQAQWLQLEGTGAWAQ